MTQIIDFKAKVSSHFTSRALINPGGVYQGLLKETLIKSGFPAAQGGAAPESSNLGVTPVTHFEAS